MPNGDEHLEIVGTYLLPDGSKSTFQGPVPRAGEVVEMRNEDGSTTRYCVDRVVWQVDRAFRDSGVPENFVILQLDDSIKAVSNEESDGRKYVLVKSAVETLVQVYDVKAENLIEETDPKQVRRGVAYAGAAAVLRSLRRVMKEMDEGELEEDDAVEEAVLRALNPTEDPAEA